MQFAGSLSEKRARLEIDASPSPAWLQSKDLFPIAGWLLLVECETTFIPSDLLPLTLGTLIGMMAVYFEWGTAGTPNAPDRSFRRLGAVELHLSVDPSKAVPNVMGWPQHQDFFVQLHPGALVSMVVTDSVQTMSSMLDETAREDAFYAMAFGLEKWARHGMPRKERIPQTWDLLDIPTHARQGEKIVKGGWLASQTWPLRPFSC